MTQRRRSRPLRLHRFGGAIRLGIVLAILIGVNVYVFFFSPGSLKQVSQAAQAASTRASGGPELVAAPVAAPVDAASPVVPAVKPQPSAKARRHEGTLREHDGLGAVLRREGLTSADSDGALRALQPLMNFRKDLRGGQAYTVRIDPNGRLESFEIRTLPGVAYIVTRADTGKLVAERSATAPAAAKKHPASPIAR